MRHQISIIIPILNEVDCIGKLLKYLLDSSSKGNIAEILVVDGGSTDGTLKVLDDVKASRLGFVCAQPDIQVIHSPKGRAKQMNLGAKHAAGNIAYFLHADSFPPKHFDQYIIDEVNKGNEAGCFRLQFDSKHWWLKLAGWLTQFNWRACRGGDQSLFISKSLFDAIGGYDENYLIYEDNILIKALFDRNQFVVVNKKLKTSSRRYKQHGIWKLQYHYWAIHLKQSFGASADDLFIYYRKHLC